MSNDGIETHMINGQASLAAPKKFSSGSEEPAVLVSALSVSALVEQCQRVAEPIAG